MNSGTWRHHVRWIVFGGVLFIISLASLYAQSADRLPQGPQTAAKQTSEDSAAKARLMASPEWMNFTARHGRRWTPSIDPRNGAPALVVGEGIPWLEDGDKGSLDQLDRLAREFLAEHYELMKVPPDGLVLNREASANLGGQQHLWNLVYEYQYENVPVLGAHVVFRLNHGRLIQFGAEKVSPVKIQTIPSFQQDTAYWVALRTVQAQPSDPVQVLDPGTLYLLPVADPAETGYAHRLIYQFIFQFPEDVRTFVIQVDAHSGQVVDLYDATRYGQVTGGVYARSVSDEREVVLPFPYVLVRNGSNKISDLGGYYTYEAGGASLALDGAYIHIQDRCGITPSLATNTEPGHLAMGTHEGTDCDVNESSHTTKAARNAFYHLNVTRQLAMKYLQRHPRARAWLDESLHANVNNASQVCNASFGGSVNFFRSSERCNNSGEISDVMQHEWGHGLDFSTKPNGQFSDNAAAEAIADINAFLNTHDPCMGTGFYKAPRISLPNCPTAVRDMTRGITRDNVDQICRPSTACPGTLGYECHCESQILSGAVFDLAQHLVERYGANEGWHVAERLYYLALPNLTQYLPDRTGSAYDALLAVADDNGNLADGVPDGDLIYAAFSHAGIAAGDPVPDYRATCTNPPETPFADLRVGDSQVTISWPAIPNAISYQIVRRVAGEGAKAFLPLASGLTETSYVDAEVSRGVDYEYLVIASDGACRSRYGEHSSTASAIKAPTGRRFVRSP